MNGAGKKVVVVTNSSSYEPRAEWVGELFKQQGAQVLWVETDFIHREKVKKVRSAPDHMYIDTGALQEESFCKASVFPV